MLTRGGSRKPSKKRATSVANLCAPDQLAIEPHGRQAQHALIRPHDALGLEAVLQLDKVRQVPELPWQQGIHEPAPRLTERLEGQAGEGRRADLLRPMER
jgi:hypothetical protein